MLRILLALTLAMICCSVAAAQETSVECPKITVIGPAEVFLPGQTIIFTVSLKNAEQLKLKFFWTVENGKIESGQGTQKLVVRLNPEIKWEAKEKATVEIAGLPAGCPNTVSEQAVTVIDRVATMLDVMGGPLVSIEEGRFKTIADALNNEPAAQLYVFVPPDKQIRSAVYERLSKYLSKSGDLSRVTYIWNEATKSLAEFWLVPPGTAPPARCQSCEAEPFLQVCPTISVIGPAGIVRPGEVVTYVAAVSDPVPKGLEYDWEVSVGTIVSQRNTSAIRVQMPADQNDVAAVATVTVKGLPVTCPNRVSETAVVSSGWDPVAIDEYGRLSRKDEKVRLAYALDQLAKGPNMVAFILIRSPKKLHRQTYNARVKTITALLRLLRVGKEDYVFVDAGDGEMSTTIYLMPPSAVPDSWKAGKYR